VVLEHRSAIEPASREEEDRLAGRSAHAGHFRHRSAIKSVRWGQPSDRMSGDPERSAAEADGISPPGSGEERGIAAVLDARSAGKSRQVNSG
jgi:hypothetical protein